MKIRRGPGRVLGAVTCLLLAIGLATGPATAAGTGAGVTSRVAVGAVRGLRVVLQRDRQVTIAWSRPATGRPTVYRVRYRGKVLTVSRSVRRVTLAGIPDGTAFSAAVRAVSHGRAGAARSVWATASGRPSAPAAPDLSLSDTGSSRAVALSWNAVAPNGPGPVEYQVLRDGADVACGWTDATSCTSLESFDGQVHTYAVRARNAEETSPREVGTPGFHMSGWSAGRTEQSASFGAIGAPSVRVWATGGSINGTVAWSANGKPVNVAITRNGSLIWSASGTTSGSHSFDDPIGYSQTGNYVVTVTDTALWPGQTSARAPRSAAASASTSPPPATVTVTKGASAVGQPGCADPSCAYIVATTANFPGNITCSVSNAYGGTAGFITWTQGGNQTKQSPDYYGYASGWVEVTCGGVTSPRFYW